MNTESGAHAAGLDGAGKSKDGEQGDSVPARSWHRWIDGVAVSLGVIIAVVSAGRLSMDLVLGRSVDPGIASALLIGLAALVWPTITSLKTPFGEIQRKQEEVLAKVEKNQEEVLAKVEKNKEAIAELDRAAKAAVKQLDEGMTPHVVDQGSILEKDSHASARELAEGTLEGPLRIAQEEQRLPPRSSKDDTQKNRFGGRPANRGRQLQGQVSKKGGGWYEVELWVQSSQPTGTISGPVKFFLHESFDPSSMLIYPRDGRARLRLSAYGSFTVGAICSDGTKLELDLADPESVVQPDEQFKDL